MAQRQRTPALQLNFNRCHCPAPNTNLATAFYLLGSGKLSLVGPTLAFSAGPFLSTPATFSSLGPCSSQCQLDPGACLPEPSFSHSFTQDCFFQLTVPTPGSTSQLSFPSSSLPGILPAPSCFFSSISSVPQRLQKEQEKTNVSLGSNRQQWRSFPVIKCFQD